MVGYAKDSKCITQGNESVCRIRTLSRLFYNAIQI